MGLRPRASFARAWSSAVMILQWTKVESYPQNPIGFQTKYTNICSVDLPWLLPLIVDVLIGRNSKARRRLINRQNITKRRRCQYSTNIFSKNTHKNKEVNKKPPPKCSLRDYCLSLKPHGLPHDIYMCINYSVSSVDILPNYGGPEGSNINKKRNRK